MLPRYPQVGAKGIDVYLLPSDERMMSAAVPDALFRTDLPRLLDVAARMDRPSAQAPSGPHRTAWKPEPVTTTDAALRAAAALGPFFAVQQDVEGNDWLPLRALLDDPDQLSERVATTRRLLGRRGGLPPEAIDVRAAASIYFLGLAARLVSPALGAAVATGTVPRLALEDVWWQRKAGGPIPIALTGTKLCEASASADLADLVYDEAVSTTVEPLAAAVQRQFRLSPQVVWGNVASAIAGGAKMIGVARPELASPAEQVAHDLLSKGLLPGAGRYVQAGAGREFIRNNCCLFYRVPGSGLCADCVLLPREGR